MGKFHTKSAKNFDTSYNFFNNVFNIVLIITKTIEIEL